MNILLLTPDAVGGTLLETTLAVYMQFQSFDRPVIDVGHVELGLEKYYSPEFNSEILRCVNDCEYNNMQSLGEIQELLESVDHYKIIKLPYYNILFRKDPIGEQLSFYKYLNDNYYIICCQRENLFEHSLSWAINKITKNLNVFLPDEKLRTFYSIFKNQITIDPLSVKQSLHSYKQYIEWAESTFHIPSYYVYEKHMPNIEQFILNLPFFADKEKTTWQDKFNISFADYNKCHYYSSDIGTIALESRKDLQKLEQYIETASAETQSENLDYSEQYNLAWEKFVTDYNSVANENWPQLDSIDDWINLPESIKQECINVHKITFYLEQMLIIDNKMQEKYSNQTQKVTIVNKKMREDLFYNLHKDFNDSYHDNYKIANDTVDEMVKLGILQFSIPIKKQTFAEKKYIVKNFEECLQMYNTWIDENQKLGKPMSDKDVEQHIEQDRSTWVDYKKIGLP